MEYRQLPHGSENEQFSVIGLGMGGIQHTPAEEIEAIIRKAIANGINYFDLCAGAEQYISPLARPSRVKEKRCFCKCILVPFMMKTANTAGVGTLQPLRKPFFGN